MRNLGDEKRIKTVAGNTPDLSKAIDDKIDEAIKLLDVTLDTNDPKLVDQITLGEKWDDPFALTKAMDTQPLYYSRWATLLRKLKKDKQKFKQMYDVWSSVIKDDLAADIFEENKNAGMTANNSKPTNQAIENRFNKYYMNEDDEENSFYQEYLDKKEPLLKIENQIDVVEVVVKAFEQRKDMLISLGSLVRSMVDNQLLIYKMKGKEKKR